jgi:hypothetical protein
VPRTTNLSEEYDAYIGVRPPHCAALTPGALDHDVETHRQTIGRRNLETGPGVRNVPYSALKLRRLIAEDDLGGLQHTFARNGSFFWHGRMP